MFKRYLLGLTGVALLSLTLFAQIASASVLVGSSGWNWGSPSPQGNTLTSLEFAGGTGYAVGYSGALVKTTDGGNTWAGIPTGVTANLGTVQLVDADSVIIGGECSMRRSDDSGSTFSRMPWTASDASCTAKITDFSFANDQSGFLLLEDGSVYRTTDGGAHWSVRTKVPGSEFTAIHFISADVGVAAAGGHIYRTTDQGGSWSDIAATGVALNDFYFTDANTGYVTGDSRKLMKTTDGGVTWTAQSVSGINGGLNLRSIRCSDTSNCLMTVMDGSVIVRTTDAGATWSTVNPSSQKVYAAGFSSSSQAVAVGDLGSTVVSSDAGANWSQVGSAVSGTIYNMKGVSKTVAVAPIYSGAGTFVRTTDGGASWSTLTASTANDVQDLSFLDADHGFVLDSQGGLLSTADGGQNWAFLNTGTDSSPYRVHAFSSTNVILVGPAGVRVSTDGGQSFSTASGKAMRKAWLDSFKPFGSEIGVAFNYDSKYSPFITKDAGKTWSEIKLPSKKTYVDDVQFVSSKIGYLLDGSNNVWKTKNGGKSWSILFGTGAAYGYSLSFESSTSGYLVSNELGDSNGGYVYHTSDGGTTWRPQLVSPFGLGTVSAVDGSAYVSDYQSDASSHLFFTNTGGDVGSASSLRITTKTKKLSKSKLKKAGYKVKISGELEGAQGGETVVVTGDCSGATCTEHKTVTVASNGTFSATFKIKKTSYFVAQYAGDADHRGVGTKVFTLKIK